MPPLDADAPPRLSLRRLMATVGVGLLVGLGACGADDGAPDTEGGDEPPGVTNLDPSDTPDDPATVGNGGGGNGADPGAPTEDGGGTDGK